MWYVRLPKSWHLEARAGNTLIYSWSKTMAGDYGVSDRVDVEIINVPQFELTAGHLIVSVYEIHQSKKCQG